MSTLTKTQGASGPTEKQNTRTWGGVISYRQRRFPLEWRHTKSDILNNQFQSVYTCKDTNNLPDKGPSHHLIMGNVSVNITGVIKLLKNLNAYKAAGPETIPLFILKTAVKEHAPVLTKIFQRVTEFWHSTWRFEESQHRSRLQKGDKHQAGNYRSVSLTSVTCKNLEHIVHSSIILHFLSNSILCDN